MSNELSEKIKKAILESMELQEKKAKKCWKGYSPGGGKPGVPKTKKGKGGKRVNNCEKNKSKKTNESFEDEQGNEGSMHRTHLAQIQKYSGELLDIIKDSDDLPEWVEAKITIAEENIVAVKHYLKGQLAREEGILEAEYKGRKVELEKPIRTPGKKKKKKVYVDPDGDGKAQVVPFGDPNMENRSDNPEAKKSFRARHDCDNKKDKTTPGYWSCKDWE